MLNEKLMEKLESIQGSICLTPEKKLAYALTENYGVSNCRNCGMCCTGTCDGGCQWVFLDRLNCRSY